MADNFTDHLETKIAEHFFRAGGAAAVAQPAGLYVGLFTSDPGEAASGGTEVSGGGYVRMAVSFGAPTDNAGKKRIANTAAIEWAAASADWGNVTHYVILDAVSAGNRMVSGPLAAAKNVQNGDIFRLPAGNVTVDIG